MLDVKQFILSNIDMHYSGSQILFDINFKAEIGKITSVIGPNGVGKTALLKVMSGLHPISKGTYFASGIKVNNSNQYNLARNGIAYVPQGREIFPLLSVKENLEIGFSCLEKEKKFIPSSIFEMFPVLSDMLNRRGGDLSGGQQQQLAIARALVTRPKLLLLDEPTEGIQPNIIMQIGKVISSLKDEGSIAIVLVEQYFDFAFELSDFTYVMKRGRFVLEGKTNQIGKKKLLEAVSL
ncbi:urea ABC transporter ATP-binding subunit UrtE [Paracoccaceae bacterium]|nr:urea ABC transporter ATP-binding subunit UrtE [Paracoccaceae bacterium]